MEEDTQVHTRSQQARWYQMTHDRTFGRDLQSRPNNNVPRFLLRIMLAHLL